MSESAVESTDEDVEVVDVDASAIAAVRGPATRATLSSEIYRRLDLVWPYVRATDLVTNHNVVVYEDAIASPEGGEIEVGVQVDRPFEGESPEGVRCVELPAARVARAVHRGPYDRIGETNAKILAFCQESGLRLAGRSWEIYGDWTDDPQELETEILYAVDAS